jgi:hypothetical protein
MKTSNKLLLGLLVLVLIGITAFAIAAKMSINTNTIDGNGKSSSQTRQLEKFSKIDARGRVKIYLTQGANTQLKINADENLIPLVISEVEDGELKIKLKNRIRRGENVELYLTADSGLEEMKFASEATVETPEGLSGEKLKVESTAGAQARVKLRYKEVVSAAHAGGDLTLLGLSNIATFIFTSGGNIHAEDFKVEKGIAEGSSGGNATIKVDKELDIEVSSGANLNYSGQAVLNRINQSSGGNINKQ